MAVTIHIQSDTEHLPRGERTRANIVIETDEPLKRVRNISALFRADERAEADYSVTTSDSKGNTKSETRTAVDLHDIVKEDFLLQGDPSPGCVAGLLDTLASIVGAGKGTTLEPGKYEFPVEFTLPIDAPQSLAGRKAKIFYELSVRIDRSLAIDPREKRSYTVLPRPQQTVGETVLVHYPDEDGRSFWDRTFGKDADLALAISNNVFQAGDNLQAMFTAKTDSPIAIRKATARLVCIERTRAGGHTDSATHFSDPVLIAEQREITDDFSVRFTLPVESIGPPSIGAHNFDIDWYLEVTLDVPWARDPQIRAPIRVVVLPDHAVD